MNMHTKIEIMPDPSILHLMPLTVPSWSSSFSDIKSEATAEKWRLAPLSTTHVSPQLFSSEVDASDAWR